MFRTVRSSVMAHDSDRVPMLYFGLVKSDFLDYGVLPTVYSVGEEAPLYYLPSDGNVTTRLQLVVAEYTVDGQFVGYQSVDDGRLQLCRGSAKLLNAAYDIGVDYRQQV